MGEAQPEDVFSSRDDVLSDISLNDITITKQKVLRIRENRDAP
jgi:hypothetical protein